MHVWDGRCTGTQPTPETLKREETFEDELELILGMPAQVCPGRVSKNDNDLSAATRHYARATVLDDALAEAHQGTSLVSSKRFADAIPLLRNTRSWLDSRLGTSSAGVSERKKDDANREAALQRETAASLEKVRRRVAEGLLQKQDSQGETQSPDQPKQ
jgi:hypothetical protein